MANDDLIERLYRSLDAHDGATMAACYQPNAVFEDPAFGELRNGEVREMWRMLCSRATDLSVSLLEHQTDAAQGTARWEARYNFPESGRDVVNVVSSRFTFADGLIERQHDSFDLRRWAAQALGAPGRALGMTPLLAPLIRRRTAAQLKAWRAAGS